MESNHESGSSQIFESTLFFQGPPLKSWPSDLTSQRSRKSYTIDIAEIERKTRKNFPELFHLRAGERQSTEQCTLQSMTSLLYPSDIPYKFQHTCRKKTTANHDHMATEEGWSGKYPISTEKSPISTSGRSARKGFLRKRSAALSFAHWTHLNTMRGLK